MGASFSVGDIGNAKNVVLVLLRSSPGGPEVLLTREGMRAAHKNRHKWALPGGGIDGVDRGSARNAYAREAREEVGLRVPMWFPHGDYDVDYVMCGSTAYFFRVLRPANSALDGLLYPDGHVGFKFTDPRTGKKELDAAQWTPLSVVLRGGNSIMTYLKAKKQDSEGLRRCFAWCLKDPNVLGALRVLQGKLGG
jgi:8-oxo-dGTP pyrophosphatase MutT (NUDIX family)